MQRHEPLFNVPQVVVVLLGLLFAIHAIRWFLPEDLDTAMVLSMAFIPSRYAGDAALLPGGTTALFTSPFTYQLLHGNLTHIMFNGLWLLAFGGIIAMRVGATRFLAFSAFTGVVAALAFLTFNWGGRLPVIGASGAVAGLMGGAMRFLFSAIDLGGIGLLREAPQRVPLMPLSVALKDRRVLVATGILIAINLLAFVGVGTAGVSAGAIAWESHIGGYLAGLLTFGLFDRPAPKRPDLRVVPTIH
ncbi:MAG: rhomboid family intramembrane serine protease [Hyphomicrobiaceae bacterium]|nr:rhomboid family intramembrane serine protease [Hyphomicrobiaceae bacterium]